MIQKLLVFYLIFTGKYCHEGSSNPNCMAILKEPQSKIKHFVEIKAFIFHGIKVKAIKSDSCNRGNNSVTLEMRTERPLNVLGSHATFIRKLFFTNLNKIKLKLNNK